MNNFKNNHRRNRYKVNGDRGFRKRNGNGHKSNSEFNSNIDFRRKNPGRNNQNASKLVNKYNDMAREALSNGDKILSENYMQHADHFARIMNAQELEKDSNKSKDNNHSAENTTDNSLTNSEKEKNAESQTEIID